MNSTPKKIISALVSASTLAFISSCKPTETNSAQADTNTTPEVTSEPVKMDKKVIEKVTKTEAEWKAQLTEEQYYVARQSGTEPAFSARYAQFKKEGSGDYHCVGCNTKLFLSDHKFDSQSGWPSFYDIAKSENVTTIADNSAGMIRTEVVCSTCDAHLGHLFSGEGFDTPTDQRYCINGAVLKFNPDEETESN